MPVTSKVTGTSQRNRTLHTWRRDPIWLVVLAAHSTWALYPPLSKALLAYLPPFALLTVANGLTLGIATVVARPYLSRDLWRERGLWIFALITAGRSITNILSIQYTLAIYVQLINLLTPLHVAWLSRLLLKEKVPPYTFRALAVSGLGAYLVLSPDPTRLQLPRSADDVWGIAFALLSSLFLALYMAWIRRSTVRQTHPLAVYWQQTFALTALYVVLSPLNGEEWGVWSGQPLQVWLGVLALALIVLLGAALLQIWALARVNATLFSALISWRLVVALAAAWLLLGERLATGWQAAGAALVMAAGTVYLQHAAARLRGRRGAETHLPTAAGS